MSNNFQACYRFVGQVRNTKHGGGIAIYINQLYQFSERNDLSIITENIIEAQFIEINMPAKNMLIGIIYRPPNDTYKQFEDRLSAILRKINQENKKCYLMGDFNIDLLKLDLNDNSNSFINLMFSSSLYPTISKPTRITKSTATLIDNIFSNKLEEKCKTGLLLTDLLDHLPVFSSI